MNSDSMRKEEAKQEATQEPCTIEHTVTSAVSIEEALKAVRDALNTTDEQIIDTFAPALDNNDWLKVVGRRFIRELATGYQRPGGPLAMHEVVSIVNGMGLGYCPTPADFSAMGVHWVSGLVGGASAATASQVRRVLEEFYEAVLVDGPEGPPSLWERERIRQILQDPVAKWALEKSIRRRNTAIAALLNSSELIALNARCPAFCAEANSLFAEEGLRELEVAESQGHQVPSDLLLWLQDSIVESGSALDPK